jgi:hypothetical protein
MMGPMGIMKQIDLNIRKYLWHGGNSNTKKYHLINWKITKAPKYINGLGVKESSLMNMAIGAKLQWRIIIGRFKWWKKISWKKYFSGARNRCLENLVEHQKGSHIGNS